MWMPLIDRRMANPTKVSCILAHQSPALSGGKGELFRVPEPDVADLVGTDGVDTPLPQPDGNGWSKILVEVELHARRGNAFCVARPSACAAVSSAIAASTSSRHFA